MKVSIVTSFPFPEGKATSNRIQVFAEELLKSPKINFVEVFCCSASPYSSFLIERSLRVTSLRVKNINKNRLFTRAFHELAIALRLIRESRKTDSDIMIVTIPSILLLVPLIFSPRKFILALDLRDAVWTYFGTSFLSLLAKKIIVILFKFVAKRSEIISVTNIEESEQIKKITGFSPLLISNGISVERLNEMQSLTASSEFKPIRLTYLGNVGIAQELDKLIDFTKKIEDLEINIVGDGAKLKELIQKCEIENISNVTFTGSVSYHEVKKYIESANMLFAQIGVKYKTAVPTKVFEYIASGRKIILGLPEGPAKAIFSRFYGLEIFEVGSKESFLESYNRLLRFEITENHKYKNLEILRSDYLREKSARRLVKAIENVKI